MKTLDDIDIFETLEYIKRTAPKLAKCKADRIYLEEFRKTKKAQLMATQIGDPVNAQERYAYAHSEYLEVLEGLRAAIALEEEYQLRKSFRDKFLMYSNEALFDFVEKQKRISVN